MNGKGFRSSLLKASAITSILMSSMVAMTVPTYALSQNIVGLPGGTNYAPNGAFEMLYGLPRIDLEAGSVYKFEGSSTGYTMAIHFSQMDTSHWDQFLGNTADLFLDYYADGTLTTLISKSTYSGNLSTTNFGFVGTTGNYWGYFTLSTPSTEFYVKNLSFESQEGSMAFDGSYDFSLHTDKKVMLYKGNATFNATMYQAYVAPADTVAPVIDGYEGVYVTNVDSPVDVSAVKALLQAYDDQDGNLTSSIVISSDDYTPNKNTVGVYPVVFSVADSAGNSSSITINVSVVDNLAPVINGASSVNSTLSAPLTVNDVKGILTGTDNYDGTITGNIIVKTDNYTANKNTVGTYTIVFELADSSGNKTTKTVSVAVHDDIKPTISGSATYTKGSGAILSVETIKAGLVGTDNVDGTLASSSITVHEDNYSSLANRVGTRTISFVATDASGNVSTPFVVTIQVTDTVAPVFYVDNSIINIDEYTSMNHDQIIALLSITGQIDRSMNSEVAFIVDEYSGNETKVGLYNLSLKVDYENGETEVLNLQMNVFPKSQSITVPAEPTFFESVGMFFVNAWNWIKGAGKWVFDNVIMPVVDFITN